MLGGGLAGGLLSQRVPLLWWPVFPSPPPASGVSSGLFLLPEAGPRHSGCPMCGCQGPGQDRGRGA